MKLVISIIILFLSSTIFSQEIIFNWNKTIGDMNKTSGRSIQADSAGFLYACGEFSGTFMVNQTTWATAIANDGYLLKMDTLGNIVWFKQFTSSSAVVINSLCIDHSNKIIILGNYKNEIIFDTIIHTNNTDTIYSSNMFIAKYDEDGGLIWAKNTGGINYSGNQITCDKDDNIIISGISIDINLFDKTEPITTLDSIYQPYPSGNYWEYYHPTESFLAKYTTNGDLEWIKNAGENNHALITDHHSNIIITGNMYHDTYFDQTLVPHIGFETTYLAKYSPLGLLQWVQTSGGSSNNNCGYSLATDAEDHIYQGGQMGGNNVEFNHQVLYDFSGESAFIAKYASNGSFQWAHEIGTPRNMTGESNYNIINSLLIDGNHNILLMGIFKDNLAIANTRIISEGAPDLMLLKYTLAGIPIKAAQFTHYGWTGGNKICLGRDNNLYYTGYTSLLSWDSRDPMYALIGKINPSIPTSPLGVNKETRLKFKIYPNPSQGKFFIEKPQGFEKNIILSIYNSLGILIQTQHLSEFNSSFQISSCGVYFVELKSQNATLVKKLIVN
jgi:hypothetical protein